MKTDAAWFASLLAQTPQEKDRNLKEFPNGMHCLISRQERGGDFPERSQEKEAGTEQKKESEVYPP